MPTPVTLPNLGLTGDWTDGQKAWGAGMRANLRTLDTLLHSSVKAIQNSPPGSPVDGDRYIIGASPTAPWSSTNDIACWDATTGLWTTYAPRAGWTAYNEATGRQMQYNGAAWVNASVVVVGRALTETVATALAALGGTGEVSVPSGSWAASTATLSDGVTLRGEGQGATTLTCADASADIVRVHGSWVVIRDLRIVGPKVAGTGAGIKIDPAGLINTTLAGTVISSVQVKDTASWSVYIAATAIKCSIRDSLFYNAYSGGNLYVARGGTTTIWATNTQFGGPGYGTIGNSALPRGSVWLEAVQGAFFSQCVFENGGDFAASDTPYVSIGHAGDGVLRFNWNVCFRDCYFERASSNASTAYMITTAGIVQNLRLDNCFVVNSNSGATTVGPRILKSDTDPLTAGNSSILLDAKIENTHAVSYRADFTTAEYDIVSGNPSFDNLTISNSGQNSNDGARWSSLLTSPDENTWKKLARVADGVGATLMNAHGSTTYYGSPHFKLPTFATNQIEGWQHPGEGGIVADSQVQRIKFRHSSGEWRNIANCHVSTTTPGGPKAGEVWLDTTGSPPALKVYDGTSWHAITLTT